MPFWCPITSNSGISRKITIALMGSAQNHFHHGIQNSQNFVQFMKNVPPGTLQTLCFPCPNRLWTLKGVNYHIFTKIHESVHKNATCGKKNRKLRGMNFLASSAATSENIALATGILMIREVILRQRASSSTKLQKWQISPAFGVNAPFCAQNLLFGAGNALFAKRAPKLTPAVALQRTTFSGFDPEQDPRAWEAKHVTFIVPLHSNIFKDAKAGVLTRA